MVKVGVIGCGYWAPNLIRNLYQNNDVELLWICDRSKEKLKNISRFYPTVSLTDKADEVINDRKVDAVVIATDATAHYELGKRTLSCRKHCLLEKPFALRSSQAQELVSLAEKNNKIIMAGHTFLYNNAVRKLKEYIRSDDFGKILYVYSRRLNLGRIRRDVNALWNFGPHDFSIIHYLLDEIPSTISAKGLKFIHNNSEDVVFINMDFPSGVSANLHLSWINPLKVREMVVVGKQKMIVYDDVSLSTKLKIFEKGFDKIEGTTQHPGYQDYGAFQLQIREGDCTIPKIDFKEPLREECDHFIDCIREGKTPITDGNNGAVIVRLLEIAQESMDKNGKTLECSLK